MHMILYSNFFLCQLNLALKQSLFPEQYIIKTHLSKNNK